MGWTPDWASAVRGFALLCECGLQQRIVENFKLPSGFCSAYVPMQSLITCEVPLVTSLTSLEVCSTVRYKSSHEKKKKSQPCPVPPATQIYSHQAPAQERRREGQLLREEVDKRGSRAGSGEEIHGVCGE